MNEPRAGEAGGGRALFREAVEGIGYYSISTLVRIPLNLLVIPIYTRVLTPVDYGILEILDLSSHLAAVLLGSNLGVALFYYYAQAADQQGRQRALSTACNGALMMSAVSFCLLMPSAGLAGRLAFGAETPEYTRAMRLLFATLTLNFPVEMTAMCLRATNQPRAYAAVAVARQLATALLTVVLVAFFRTGYVGMLWSTLLVSATVGLYLLWRFRRTFLGGLEVSLFWKYLAYSWPLSISSLATLALVMGDRYILQRYVSLAEVGIYSLAYKFGFLVSTVSLVFNMYWKPAMFTTLQRENGEHYYKRATTYYNAMIVWVMLALSTLLLPAVTIATGRSFHQATAYIPLFALTYSIRAVGEFNRNPLYLEKRTSVEAALSWLGCVLAVGGYLLFIPRFGLRGGILSSAGAFALLYVAGTWLARRYRPMPVEWRRIAAVWLCGAALMAVYHLLPVSSLAGQAALGLVCVAALPASIWLLGLVQADERQAVADVVRIVVRRLRRIAGRTTEPGAN